MALQSILKRDAVQFNSRAEEILPALIERPALYLNAARQMPLADEDEVRF